MSPVTLHWRSVIVGYLIGYCGFKHHIQQSVVVVLCSKSVDKFLPCEIMALCAHVFQHIRCTQCTDLPSEPQRPFMGEAINQTGAVSITTAKAGSPRIRTKTLVRLVTGRKAVRGWRPAWLCFGEKVSDFLGADGAFAQHTPGLLFVGKVHDGGRHVAR